MSVLRPGPPQDAATSAAEPPRRRGPVSKALLTWVVPILVKGYSRPLVEEDPPRLQPHLRCRPLSEQAELLWKEEGLRGRARLWRVLLRLGRWELITGALSGLLQGLLNVVLRPLMLRTLIQAIAAGESDASSHALLLCFFSLVIFAEGVFNTISRHLLGDDLGTKFVGAATSLIARKAATISSSAYSASEESVLVGTDVVRTFENFVMFAQAPSFVSGIIGGTVLLLTITGIPGLVGLAVMSSLMLANMQMAKVNKRLEAKNLEAADKRVKLMRQILDGVKAIKLMAWEEPYLEAVSEARAVEIRLIRRFRLFFAYTSNVGRANPAISACSCFVFLALIRGDALTPENVFATITIFQSLRMPLILIPALLTISAQMRVSFGRIEKYLSLPDAPSREVLPDGSALAVRVASGSFSWAGALQPALTGVNLSLRRGSLTAVVGSVGAGKTSLLMGLLGEMAHTGGVETARSVAFIPQKPFVLSGALRDNVLMGRPWDEASYQEALKGSQLLADLALMVDGDATEIGERGVTLSGGQQQRLAVARALYGRPELLVADDTLSAVDGRVGNAIFEHAFEYRVRHHGVTLVMALNQMHLLQRFDLILHVSGGRICRQGTFAELTQGADAPFADLAGASSGEDGGNGAEAGQALADGDASAPPMCGEQGVEETGTGLADGAASAPPAGASGGRGWCPACLPTELLSLGRAWQTTPPALAHRESPPPLLHHGIMGAAAASSLLRPEVAVQNGCARLADVQLEVVDEEGGVTKEDAGNGQKRVVPPTPATLPHAKSRKSNLTEAEKQQTGAVALSVVATYVRAMGIPTIAFGLVSCAASYGAMAGTDAWIAHWVRAAQEAEAAGEAVDLGFFIGVYVTLLSTYLACMLAATYSFNEGSARAGKRLHGDCLTRILHAPVSWFEATPSGRILSRFSSDLTIVDVRLSDMVDVFAQFCFTILAVLILICIITPFVAPAAAVGVTLFYIQYSAVDRSQREVKRFSNTALSPVLTNISEVVSARVLIHIMDYGDFFHARHCEFTDRFSRYNYFSQVLLNWGMLCGTMIAFGLTTITAAIVLWQSGELDPSLAALALTYSYLMPYFFMIFSGILGFLKKCLTSLERLLEYRGDVVAQEQAWELPGEKADQMLASWPAEGGVSFRDVTLVYRPGLDPAVRNVSFEIRGGERVGVVGRTGAGKSSLIVLLFRVCEATSGQVLVDGRDISSVGLQTLRKRLTVVPQEPLLMQGTVHSNMDPFGKHSRGELRGALAASGLGERLLDAEVGAGGRSISAGEAQLVSFARTLLRRTKLVIMDEPTSNIDSATDAKVQLVVRSAYTGSTLLTIAHRLETVIDGDRMIVMDAGRVVENGPPRDLVDDPTSRLSCMLDGLGPDLAQRLRQRARARDL